MPAFAPDDYQLMSNAVLVIHASIVVVVIG